MGRLLLLTEMPGSPFIIDERHQRSRDSSILNRLFTIAQVMLVIITATILPDGVLVYPIRTFSPGMRRKKMICLHCIISLWV